MIDLFDLPVDYRTIVADPPWPYRDANSDSRALAVADTKRTTRTGRQVVQVNAWTYAPMSVENISSLPVRQIAAANAHLYLWFTNAFAEEAHAIARAWGFKPKTIITWVKVKEDGTPSMKTGYYFRGATEHALFCVRGSLKPRTKAAIPTAFLHPRIHQHSAKPDVFFNRVVQPISYPRGLEMFARKRRKGWDVWGNEV